MPTYQYRPSDPNSIELVEYDDGAVPLSVTSTVDRELFRGTMKLSEGDLVPGIVFKPLVIAEFIQPDDPSYASWPELAERIRPSGELDRSTAEKVEELLASSKLDREQASALAELAVETEWGEFISPTTLGYDATEGNIEELSQLAQ